MSFNFLSSCQCWQPEAEHLQLSLAFGKQNLSFALRCTSETLLIQTIIILKRVPAISVFCLEVSEHLIYRHKMSHLIAWNQRFHILIELLRELILLLSFFPKLFSLSDVKVIKEYLSWLSNGRNNFTKVVCTGWIYPRPDLHTPSVISKWTPLAYCAWLSALELPTPLFLVACKEGRCQESWIIASP